MWIHQTFHELVAFVLRCTNKCTDNFIKLPHRLVLNPHIFLRRNYAYLSCNEEAEGSMRPRYGMEEVAVFLLQTVRHCECQHSTSKHLTMRYITNRLCRYIDVFMLEVPINNVTGQAWHQEDLLHVCIMHTTSIPSLEMGIELNTNRPRQTRTLLIVKPNGTRTLYWAKQNRTRTSDGPRTN